MTPAVAKTALQSTWRAVPGTPLKVSSGVAAGTEVTVFDQTAVHAAGAIGFLGTMTAPRSNATTASGSSVSLSYAGFADAYGADFATRLRLVELPTCAVTTPTLATCRIQTQLANSGNDVASHTLTATLPAATSAAQPSNATKAASAAPTSTRVLAIAADPAGPQGSFAASSLKPTGTWSAGGSSGSFAYQYPISVPPAAAGAVAPKISLSYDSSRVDGLTADTNNQPSWIGEGWDYTPGYIERSYVACADDPRGVVSKTEDLCWNDDVVSLSLSGTTTELIHNDTANNDGTGAWVPAKADGTTVTLMTGAANGDAGSAGTGKFAQSGGTGEYWKVTTPDGTSYWFGRTYGPGRTNQASTNSTWTVPVYGAHAGDPCYSSAGFASSRCDQAWRWNLDYVEDVHGNAAMYYYTPETNAYAAKEATTATASYIRGGFLDHINYGLRNLNNSVYASTAPQQVTFAVSDRLNGTAWPDTPTDQACTAGAACSVKTPTFWTKKKLVAIHTQTWNSATSTYDVVDDYNLSQSFPSAMQVLWLDSIQRVGHPVAGNHSSPTANVPTPATTFKPFTNLLDNRVEGYNSMPAMGRWRMGNIQSETGSTTSILYSDKQCTATNVPAEASTNTMRCYPVWWRQPYTTKKTLDYFHKYVVTEVHQDDPSNIVPSQYTLYTYLGFPAWHYDDNELVVAANRTYGQFRGYSQVETRTGSKTNSVNGVPDTWTLTRSSYFRGMDGDTMPGNTTRSVKVNDSLGGAAENITDINEFSSSVREVQQFSGGGTGSAPSAVGTQLSTTISDLSRVRVAASRARTNLPAQIATTDGTTRTRTIQSVLSAATPTTRMTTMTTTLDQIGRPTQVQTIGDNVDPTCVRTTFAGDGGSNTVTGTILEAVAEMITSAQTCPTSGGQSPVVADVRTYYDGSATLGLIPTAGDGDATMVKTANNKVGSAFNWGVVKTTYDPSGRPTKTTALPGDGTTRNTQMAYTPTDGGVLSLVTTTNPLNQTSTKQLDPRGDVLREVDVAGHPTDATYDGLGRTTGVWLPGRTFGSSAASKTYEYLLQQNGPEAVTTTSIVDTGATGTLPTSKQISIYDSLGQLRQTQASNPQGGRIITDAFVDSHGWVIESRNRYWDGTAAPTTSIVTAATIPDNGVDSRTQNTYDGSGRPTLAKDFDKQGTLTRQTSIIYGGDRVTTIPPVGTTATTVLSDVLGRTTETRRYTSAPTVSGNVVSGGTYQSTTYGYTALGQQDSVKDASTGGTPHEWSMTYDLAGRVVHQENPDSGSSDSTYSDTGERTDIVDARGNAYARHFDYDLLGRKTQEKSGPTSSATLVATWTYDSVQTGQLTQSTSYVNGDTANPYTVSSLGYDSAGRSRGSKITLPNSEGALASTSYSTTQTWSSTGLPLASGYPAAGNSAAETVTTGYNNSGLPVTLAGTNQYVTEATYSPYGQFLQIKGHEDGNIALTYIRDIETQRIADQSETAQTTPATIEAIHYTYDQSGNVTRSADQRGADGDPVRTMCYRYNALVELTAAWSALLNDTCSATPSDVNSSTVGGDHPQWQTWSYLDGLRSSQVDHAVPGGAGATTTTNYNNGVVDGQTGDMTSVGTHPHALSSAVATTGAATATTQQGYDAAGNTTTRVLPNTPATGASTTQSLKWDADGRLQQVDATVQGSSTTNTTKYVYDADGNQLIRRDPSETTLYLPGQELQLTTAGSGSGTLFTTRWYHLGDQQIAERAGFGLYFQTQDQLGTATLNLGWTSYGAKRRTFDPYGNAVGTAAAWSDDHGLMDKSVDTATQMADVGVRKYDAVTGRFLSVDPVLAPGDPESLGQYSYANNNPVNRADPSGARPIDLDSNGRSVEVPVYDWQGATNVYSSKTHTWVNYRTNSPMWRYDDKYAKARKRLSKAFVNVIPSKDKAHRQKIGTFDFGGKQIAVYNFDPPDQGVALDDHVFFGTELTPLSMGEPSSWVVGFGGCFATCGSVSFQNWHTTITVGGVGASAKGPYVGQSSSKGDRFDFGLIQNQSVGWVGASVPLDSYNDHGTKGVRDGIGEVDFGAGPGLQFGAQGFVTLPNQYDMYNIARDKLEQWNETYNK